MKKYIVGMLLIITLSVLFGCEEEQLADNQLDKTDEIQQDDTTNQNKEANTSLDEEEQADAPFFWKVENENNTVYLLGSIHVGSADMYPMNEVVEDAYESSDSLVVEANILQEPEEMFGEQFITKAVYVDGSVLSDHISEKSYEQLSEVVSHYDLEGLTMTELNQFKPWLIELLLSDLLISEEETLQSQYGIDYHFLERATEDNKPILELESINEQIMFYSDMPEAIQIQSLEDSISALQEEASDDAIQQLIEAWKSGSEEKLAELISINKNDGTLTDYQAYENELMETRNTNMVEKINGYLTEESGQTYFVVVGAAHYLDDIGLDNLLGNDFTVQSYEEIN